MLGRCQRALYPSDSLTFPFQQQRSEALCQPVVNIYITCPLFRNLDDEPGVLVPLKTLQLLSLTASSHRATLVRPQLLSTMFSAIPLPQPAPGAWATWASRVLSWMGCYGNIFHLKPM